MADHPRSRGVYGRRDTPGLTREGSSPLARGLPDEIGVGSRRVGIIPARAGFTVSQASNARTTGDHPRSRGVYACLGIGDLGGWGSSPLARGLLIQVEPLADCNRIIPARAGFTVRAARASETVRDHPRSRGVYPEMPSDVITTRGSSPLARGLRSSSWVEVIKGGIIPARAGFTWAASRQSCPCQDHPRSRGVYWQIGVRRSVIRGSSPLARGLPMAPATFSQTTGIIPARAGFTLCDGPLGGVVEDHPRSRGVYTPSPSCDGRGLGSSPLARGLHPPRRRRGLPIRIIPARAGFTPDGAPPPPPFPDHPRSRGVYVYRGEREMD